MRVAVTLLVLSAGSGLLAAPQFDAGQKVKNLFSSLASGGGGQDEDSGSEKVPYTTLKQFDVRSGENLQHKLLSLFLGLRDETVSKCEVGVHRVDV